MVVGLLAILKAGGAYLPLEPTYPADRRHRRLLPAWRPLVSGGAPLHRNRAYVREAASLGHAV
jgi:hypothetical protein